MIDHYAGSPSMGMEFRPFYLAREWVRSGHRVTILLADQSHLRQKNPKLKREFAHWREEGVDFLAAKTRRYRGNGADRFKNVLDFTLKLWICGDIIADQMEPDVVIASSTHPFDVLPAGRIARLAGAPLIYEVHDLWPLSPMELYHMGKRNPLIVLINWFCRLALSRADAVVSVLPFANRYFKEKGWRARHYTYIPNGVALDAPAQAPPEAYGRAAADLRERFGFVVAYAGGFSEANAIGDLIKTAEILKKEAGFLLVGDGPKKETYKKQAENLDNIIFLPPVSKNAVISVLQSADCLYLGAKDNIIYRYGAGMNKLYDYLLSGVPLVFAVGSPNDPVREAGCGVSVPPGNPGKSAGAVRRLIGLDAKERSKLGQNGRDYVLAHHDYQLLARQFIMLMEDLMDGKEG